MDKIPSYDPQDPQWDWCTCGHLRLLHGIVAGERRGRCTFLHQCTCKSFVLGKSPVDKEKGEDDGTSE